MSDPIRTPADALEAAAQAAFAAMIRGNSANVAEEIRALASRIPPAPDDEALAEIIRTGLLKVYGDEPTYYDPVKAILAAFREAGAMR